MRAESSTPNVRVPFVDGSVAVGLIRRHEFVWHPGLRISYQCYQAISECATPTEVIVPADKFLIVYLVSFGVQDVAQNASAEKNGVGASCGVEFGASGVQVKAQRLSGVGDELAHEPIGLRVGIHRVSGRVRSQMEGAGLRENIAKGLGMPQTGAGGSKSASARSCHNGLAGIAREVVHAVSPGQ